jgi:hypothetical protein
MNVPSTALKLLFGKGVPATSCSRVCAQKWFNNAMGLRKDASLFLLIFTAPDETARQSPGIASP